MFRRYWQNVVLLASGLAAIGMLFLYWSIISWSIEPSIESSEHSHPTASLAFTFGSCAGTVSAGILLIAIIFDLVEHVGDRLLPPLEGEEDV